MLHLSLMQLSLTLDFMTSSIINIMSWRIIPKLNFKKPYFRIAFKLMKPDSTKSKDSISILPTALKNAGNYRKGTQL